MQFTTATPAEFQEIFDRIDFDELRAWLCAR